MSLLDVIREPSTQHRLLTLLNQQCWCWGQDVLRKQGNWLLHLGFERLAAESDLKEHGSIYQRQIAGGGTVLLRGFGVLLGHRDRGGVFLPRFDPAPVYSSEWPPTPLPWRIASLSQWAEPAAEGREQCEALLVELLSWISNYEQQVNEQLGAAYREQTLRKWDGGLTAVIPGRQYAAEWRSLINDLQEFCRPA